MNDPVVDVILLDVPVPLWAKSRAHLERALCELASDEAIPAHFADLYRRIRGEYVVMAETADAEVKAAAVRRAETVDVAYPVPRRAGADLASFLQAAVELDEYARKAGRDDLVRPPDCVNFWRWYITEIVKQLDGGFPAPWPGD